MLTISSETLSPIFLAKLTYSLRVDWKKYPGENCYNVFSAMIRARKLLRTKFVVLIVRQDSKFRLQIILNPLKIHSRGWRNNPAFQQRRYCQKCLSEIIDSATHCNSASELPDTTLYSAVFVVTNCHIAKQNRLATPAWPAQIMPRSQYMQYADRGLVVC
jgi:hypothetical protein